MSAEAIARLREVLRVYDADHDDMGDYLVSMDDLHALLDAYEALAAEFKKRTEEWADAQRVFLAAEAAHTEALGALANVLAWRDAFLRSQVLPGRDEALDIAKARAVLTKAGRR